MVLFKSKMLTIFGYTVVPLFSGHYWFQAKVSLHWGCPLIRGTDILEWAVGPWGASFVGMKNALCACTLYSVHVTKKTWSWINKYNVK